MRIASTGAYTCFIPNRMLPPVFGWGIPVYEEGRGVDKELSAVRGLPRGSSGFPLLERKRGGVFRSINRLPFALDDSFANLRRRFAFARLLIRVKVFIDADVATRTVLAYKAIQQTPVPLAAVAMAIARLLVEDSLHARCHRVRVHDDWLTKRLRVHR